MIHKIKGKNEIPGYKCTDSESKMLIADIKELLVNIEGINKIIIYYHMDSNYLKRYNVLLEVNQGYELIYALDDTLTKIENKLIKFSNDEMSYNSYIGEIYLLWK